MHRLGLIAGEQPQVFRRCVESLRRNMAGQQVPFELVLADAHVPDLLPALDREDHEAVSRALVAAALRLRADGVDGLALCSWRLHEHAEKIDDTGEFPMLRLDRMLGQTLASAGAVAVGFLAHSQTYLRPDVRYRMFYEFEIDLLCPNEDAFEALDAWSMDHDTDPVPTRRRELVAGWIKSAWSRLIRVEAVIAERTELADFARKDLPFRPVIDLEDVWVDGLVRFLCDSPDPKPKPVPPPQVSMDAAYAAQHEVCRLLKCDPRNVDFTQDRDGEIAIVLPNMAGVGNLPDWLGGVRLIKP